MINATKDDEREALRAHLDAWIANGGTIERLSPGAGRMLMDLEDDSLDVAAEQAAA